MLHSTSISATLRELCESGWANLTKVEVKAWSELRNQVMHGKLALGGADRTKIQKQITRQQLVVNLINKVVLQAVGYSGPFFDYSTWGISRFEPKVAVVAPIEDRA